MPAQPFQFEVDSTIIIPTRICVQVWTKFESKNLQSPEICKLEIYQEEDTWQLWAKSTVFDIGYGEISYYVFAREYRVSPTKSIVYRNL